jgi:hypothetical protein
MKNKILYLISVALVFILILSMPVSAGWWNNLFKVAEDNKQVIKAEVKVEPKLTNYEKGMQWERTAETGICEAAGGCANTFAAAEKMLRASKGIEETFTIYGGKATNKFINENKLYKTWTFTQFTREPDFLEVKQINGRITGIKIIDAKVSQQAARAEQEAAFIDLCAKSNIPCSVEYVVPKSSLSQSDSSFLCLMTIPLALTGPAGVGLEALCFLATS